MRIAAVDYGTVRVGIALSDELGMIASPYATIQTKSDEERLQKTAEALVKTGAGKVLVGLPKHMNGSEGESAKLARDFAEKLGGFPGMPPVQMVDERLSTLQASKMMRESGRKAKEQKGVIDSAAAVVMLQSYLDASTGMPPSDW